MRFSLRNMHFKINCPNCNSEIKVKVKDVNVPFVCKSCGKTIHLQDKNFSQNVREAEKLISKFEKSFNPSRH